MTAIEIWNEKIGTQVVKALKSNFFEAYYCSTKKEAKEKILSLIPENDIVSWGGCRTMEEIGVIEEMKSGKYNVIDRDTAKTPDTKFTMMHQ